MMSNRLGFLGVFFCFCFSLSLLLLGFLRYIRTIALYTMMRRYPARMAKRTAHENFLFFFLSFHSRPFSLSPPLTVCFPTLDFYLTCDRIRIDVSTWI